MSRLPVHALLLLTCLVFCDSRSILRPPYEQPASSKKNFGFFPSFAGTNFRDPVQFTRIGRSVELEPSAPKESDVLNVDDFIARNGLDFGKGDDEDVQEDPHAKLRAKREGEEEAAANDLSWLLEQDAWEKVDDADLDWENVGREEFDASAEVLKRESRSADLQGNAAENDQGISEDALDQKIRQLTEDLKRLRKTFAVQGGVGEAAVKDSIQDSALGNGENKIDDDYLDLVTWRRKRSVDNEIVDIVGRIDMTFESKPDNPTATVIIKKDPQSPNPPEVPPPIYFCGTKTDPNNPDSVSGEVSETVA